MSNSGPGLEVETDLGAYYARRASEYEAIYRKPERQSDLAALRADLPERVAGRDVLEVACGTGYWTEVMATRAARILATDLNPEVLAIARLKERGTCDVRFAEADAYTLDGIDGPFDAAFCGFWWSHVRRGDLAPFLAGLHGKLKPGARVVAIENAYVEGSSTPVSRVDERGNAFQLRPLADGSTHEVLKNFWTRSELEAAVGESADDIAFDSLPYYWRFSYRLRS